MQVLEVVALNVNDVIELSKLDCDRIDFGVDIKTEGLSAEIELVKEVLRVTKKPVRFMLRFTADFCCESEQLQNYLDYIDQVKKLNSEFLEGFVLGFLKDNKLDVHVCDALISQIAPLKVTLHKASDILFENDDMLELIELYNKHANFDTILTQGGQKPFIENIDKINKYKADLNLLIGGGVFSDNIDLVIGTGCSVHIGRFARVNQNYDYGFDYQLITDIKNKLNQI